MQQGHNERMFAFKPEAEGRYEIRIRVVDKTDEGESVTESETEVVCYPSEADRDIATDGEPAAEVVEFMPAPGQFVNDVATSGYSGQSTFEEAREYAKNGSATERSYRWADSEVTS